MSFKDFLNESKIKLGKASKVDVFIMAFDKTKNGKRVSDVGVSNELMPYLNSGIMSAKQFPNLSAEDAFNKFENDNKNIVLKNIAKQIFSKFSVSIETNTDKKLVGKTDKIDLSKLKLNSDWVKESSDDDNGEVYVISFNHKDHPVTVEFYNEDSDTFITFTKNV